MNKIKSIIESVLFVVDKPISVDKLGIVIGEALNKEDLITVLETMTQEYLNDDTRGIKLVEVAGGWQFRTKQENTDWIKKLENTRTTKISQAALETLAIIAYKQPITKFDIEKIRGVDSLHLVKTLLEKNLIKIAGRSILPGKALLYSTSNEFLEMFNLKTIDDLPSNSEIMTMFENSVGKTLDLENIHDVLSSDSTQENADELILDEVEKISKELNIDLDLVQEKVDILFEEACRKFKNQREETKESRVY